MPKWPATRPARRPAVAPQRKKTPALRDCHLGIDIGSHRTRICLWIDGSEYVVENKYNHSTDTSSYAGDFPSALYVFDDDEDGDNSDVYPVEGENPNRLSVSAKYVFYALADASDVLLEQYPLVHHLVSRKQDPSFRAKLRAAMVKLLSVLRERALVACRAKGLRIAKVGLTIPVQWGLEFEAVYQGLVAEVFAIDKNAIYFFTETEALARYLFKHYADQLDPDGKYNTVMFFDFGGHNMNGCAFGVARDLKSPERNSFYRVGKKFGAGGGSEQWEHYIKEWFMDSWYGMNNVFAPLEHCEDFLGRFRKQKCVKEELRQAICAIYPRTGIDAPPCRITFGPEGIEAAWRKALERPLVVARREIARLVGMVESGSVTSPLVVVSGGSARNPAVKSRMAALCGQSGVPVVFTDDFDVRITYESAKVAKAASYVVSETLTLEQFFARGAAIGIQMKQSPIQGKKPDKKTAGLWDYSGELLLSLRRRCSADIPVRYYDEFKLICDPFFEHLHRKKQDCVAASRSYDLVYLGRRKQGTWTFQLSLDGSGDEMALVLQQLYRRRRKDPPKTKKTLRLPLYFDGNSGCIHVGERNKTLDELDLGLPVQPDELGEVDTDAAAASEESSEDDESDVDSETASRITVDAGTIITGSSNAGDEAGMMFTTSMFTADDPWAFPPGNGDRESDQDTQTKTGQQVEVGPIFDGLPRCRPARKRGSDGGGGEVAARAPAANHRRRMEPYGGVWERQKAKQHSSHFVF